jgi:poly(hydroxyalkanoate) granule-associated protein
MREDNTPGGLSNEDDINYEGSAPEGSNEALQKRGLAGSLRGEAIVQSVNLFLIARRILATSLGAIALSIDESNEFIARLVERGELAEHEIGALVDDLRGQVVTRGKALVQRQGELPEDASTRYGAQVNDIPVDLTARTPGVLGERVEGILERLNVPTRSDIESITSKIELLSNKVLLLKSMQARPSDVPHVGNGDAKGNHGDNVSMRAEESSQI